MFPQGACSVCNSLHDILVRLEARGLSMPMSSQMHEQRACIPDFMVATVILDGWKFSALLPSCETTVSGFTGSMVGF